MFEDILRNFIAQLPISAFEITAAAVILLFGWYFARVFGWQAQKLARSSKSYAKLQHLGWETKIRRYWRTLTLPILLDEIIKWLVFLFFVMVCLALIGFGGASHFLGTIFNYLLRAFIAFIIIIAAALCADFFKNFLAKLFAWRARSIKLIVFIAGLATWVVAALTILFTMDIATLKMLVGLGGFTVIAAGLIILLLGFGVIGRVVALAKKAGGLFKKK